MDSLYEAIGRIASAAHANGDQIDENAFPSDGNNGRHGLDIFHRGHYYRFRAAPDEPKFTVGSPFMFDSRLRDQYNPDRINERIDADFTSLTTEDQEATVESLLRSDLKTATEHEDEFHTAVQEEVTPTRFDILRMTYSEEKLWNGVFIRDDIFPRRESFDIMEYRDIVEEIRSTKLAIGDVMSATIPPLRDEYTEDMIEPEPDTAKPDSVAFY